LKNSAAEHHIVKLSCFGSVLGDDFSSGSNVDVLVEFEPGHMESELGENSRSPVDLQTQQFLSRYLRDEVLGEAEMHCVAP
jgi:predicted nucleotidyltransferase